jgi:hypothetical protein
MDTLYNSRVLLLGAVSEKAQDICISYVFIDSGKMKGQQFIA